MTEHLCEDLQAVGIKEEQQQELFKQLNKLRRQGELCDITFKCDGGDVSAHKVVLASAGNFFKALFVSPISTASSANLVFAHFSVEAVSLLLDIVYSVVDVAATHVAELLQLAEYACLDWLIDLLLENIRERINELSVCYWYEIALSSGVIKLKFLCECYVRENTNKLQLEKIEQYFDEEVFCKISFWNDKMSRDVVISADKCFKNMLFFDITHSSIARLENVGAGEMMEFLSRQGELQLYSSFLYQNVFFVVTQQKQDEDTCTLWKWHHTSKFFELIYELKTEDFEAKLIKQCADEIAALSAIQFYYDNLHSLYVVCILHFDFILPYNYCVFKFDLQQLAFYEGHIVVNGECENDPCQIAYLKELHTCIVTPDFVYPLESHDFKIPGFPAEALYRIDLDACVKEEGEDIPEVFWCPWQTVNIEGEFYCLVQSAIYDDHYSYLFILKLDIENCSWIFCAARKVCISGPNYDSQRRSLFRSNGTVYAHWKEGDSLQGTIFYLDEKKKSLEPVDFVPGAISGNIWSYTVIPYHLLL